MTNSIADITSADVILVTGSNTTEAHPVLSLQMKTAVRKHGAKLILIDPRSIELVDFVHEHEVGPLHLRLKPGSDVALFNAMANLIITENLADMEFIKSRVDGFESLAESLTGWTPERAAAICDVAPDLIRAASRTYARAGAAAIFWAMGITQHTTGTDNVKALSNLALLTGNIGRPGTGLNPLRGQNNVQGACDLGGLPNVYPGYQPVASAEAREKFASAWNVPLEQLSSTPGLTVTEIMDGILDDRIHAVFIMGENPMLSDPDLHHVEHALSQLDFLAVQDIFMNETGEVADVILPALSFAEKDGSFTSTERRVQLIRPALTLAGEARPDWQIITQLANRLGADWDYGSTSEIFDELAMVTPQYHGMSHARLAGDGLQWPCPTSDHPGTPILHVGRFARGMGLLIPVEYKPPAEETSEEYPFILSTGRILYHWHGGTMSRRSPGLDVIAPEAEVEISPTDAEQLDVDSGDMVKVESRRGEVLARVKVTRRSPAGTVFMTFHFAEAAVNLLTSSAVDPIAKIPEYKISAVRVSSV